MSEAAGVQPPSAATAAAAAAATDDKATQLTSEPAQETDEEFLARMEAEDRAAFQDAVSAWRADRAAGGGEAKVVEAGGAFAGKNEAEAEAAATPKTES
jgi:hypothetical protein